MGKVTFIHISNFNRKLRIGKLNAHENKTQSRDQVMANSIQV